MRLCAFGLMLCLVSVPWSLTQAQAITEICYSADQATSAATPPTNATQFTCPTSGVHTIDELAGMGFRIVRLTPVSGASAQTVRQRLVVERGVVIHADGFE